MKMNNNTHTSCIFVTVRIHEKVIVPSDYKETGLCHLKCRSLSPPVSATAGDVLAALWGGASL